MEADGRQKVLVGGDGVKTLPVPQLPDLTGVIAAPGCQVIPETQKHRIHESDIKTDFI